MTDTCPTCQAPIPADAPQGLCPACLMHAALDDATQQGACNSTQATTTETTCPAGVVEEANQLWEDVNLRIAERVLARFPDVPLEELKKLHVELCTSVRDEMNREDAIRGKLENIAPEQRQRVETLFARRLPDLELTGFLGAGGMGEVWLAEHRALGRKVAVKLLTTEVAQEPGFSERFTREARAMAKLDHPHIIKLYDFGESEGVFFLVMEYHPGNLRERMEKGPMPVSKALKVMLPLCDAVSAVHKAGLIHRDLKPENVLVNYVDVKLADFGLACAGTDKAFAAGNTRADGRLTQAGSIVGTPAYMAPEQWLAPETVDAPADVYALGLILYELLTGNLPRGRYAAPSFACGEPRIDAIVACALQPEPQNRYTTAEQLHAELKRLDNQLHSEALDLASSKSMPWLQFATVLAGLSFPILMLCCAAFLTAMGLSVACHTVFLYALLASIQQGSSSDRVSSRTRRLGAVLVTASVLVFDTIGPAFGLQSDTHICGAFGWIVEQCAMVVACGVASWWLTKHVSRVLGWIAFPVLLGLALAAFHVPVLELLGLWMPLVLAALNLSLFWATGTFRWNDPPPPPVESPFVESPFGLWERLGGECIIP